MTSTITKEMETALRESEERYRSIFENATIGIFRTSAEGRIITTNPAAARMLGYSSTHEAIESITDLATQLYANPEDRAHILKRLQQEGEVKVETVFITRDGERRTVALSIWIIRDEQGNFRFIEGFIEDITEKKRLEAALREREERYHSIFENANIGIMQTLPEGTIITANPACARILGYPSTDELINSITNMAEQLYKDPRQRTAMLKELMNKGQTITELNLLRKDQTEITVKADIWLVKDEQGNLRFIEGLLENITERKRAEQIIKQSEEQYRSIFDTVTDGLLIINMKGTVVGLNLAACRIYGYKREELIGLTINDIVSDESTHLFEDFKQQLKEKQRFYGEATGIRKDRTEFTADVHGIMFTYKDYPHLMAEIRDVTRQKQAEKSIQEANAELRKINEELKSAQTQLIQSEKMASLGQLTAGIAHEINNPVNFIHASISPLKRNIEDIKELYQRYKKISATKDIKQKIHELDAFAREIEADYLFEEIASLLKGMDEGAHRSKAIVQGLRSFSRMDEALFKTSNLHEGLDSTLMLLQNKLKKHVTVHKEYGLKHQVDCLPAQINQVFMNILSNSEQAIEGNGDIYIKTWKEGKNACISIRDSGKGISNETKHKIFEPFFSTKEVGKGTGLGLSISYGIMEKHKGEIKVESELGKGSTFTIILPLTQSAAG
jgi:PAS domain S-box-containing protein